MICNLGLTANANYSYKLQKIRLKGLDKLLKRYATHGHVNIVFTDEKFTVEEDCNNQTSKFIRKKKIRQKSCFKGDAKPSSNFREPQTFIFSEKGLKKIVTPLKTTLFQGKISQENTK